MKKTDQRDVVVRMMQAGTYTPLQGYRALKSIWAGMTESERTTDGCRAEIALQEHDATSFADRFLK